MPGRCCLCELQKKRYLCPACFKQSQASRRHDVAALSKERDALLERLEGALGHKASRRIARTPPKPMLVPRFCLPLVGARAGSQWSLGGA